jgi:2-succinyl-5-enolpyruvyl-6-hydroxy-3-cyclohexene-1-carboxylate synthase
LRAAIASGLANSTETGEPRCVFEALAGVPKHFPLLLGNSLSIRLTDWVFGALGELPHFFVQRGANGIDGLVAGAQGMRLMSTKGAGVLLGDVSLSHDLTSLGLFRDSKSPFVVLLLDNDGGRLFDHLPARSAVNAESDWEYFRTRPRIDWSSVARSFDIRYESPSPGALQATVAAAAIRPGVTLVHMRAEGGTKEFLARVRDELGL